MGNRKDEIIDVNEVKMEVGHARENRFSYEPPQWILRIKKHLYIGLFASIAITAIWLLAKESMRSVAIALLITAAVVALMWSGIRILTIKKAGKIKVIANTIAVLLTIIIFFSVNVVAISPKLLFYPSFDEEAYAVLTEHEQAEELAIRTEIGTLSGWLLHQSDGKAPLVLYLGGNGENSSRRMATLVEDEKLLSYFEGCHFACVDYPGYGKSEGAPSEEALKQYVLEVYDYLINREEVSEVIVLGFSLGTGVANYLASERTVAGMMLMAPYADGYDLFNGMINIFHGPLRLLVTYKMEAINFAKEVEIKPLILASPTDEMVSYTSSTRLFQAYSNGCDFVTVEGIGHNDFWDSEFVLEKIAEYIKER